MQGFYHTNPQRRMARRNTADSHVLSVSVKLFGFKNKKAENLETSMFSAKFLASLRGFEPPAYRLGGGRSIQLSYSDIVKNLRFRKPQDCVLLAASAAAKIL